MVVLEVEPKDLPMLGKRYVTELGGVVFHFKCGRVLLHNSGLPLTLGLPACLLSIGIISIRHHTPLKIISFRG